MSDALPEYIRRWALGVPEPRRGRRIVVVLTAYIDDSAQGDVLVYAGYFAPLAAWEAFDPEWRDWLNKKPKLDYFKMREAMSGTGQWAAMPDRKTRLVRFYQIASSHIMGGVSVVLPLGPFKRVYASRSDVPRQMKNKHFFIMHNVMHDLLRGSALLGADEPIDFVFDNQTRGKDQVWQLAAI